MSQQWKGSQRAGAISGTFHCKTCIKQPLNKFKTVREDNRLGNINEVLISVGGSLLPGMSEEGQKSSLA
jgi:hypothetical protein